MTATHGRKASILVTSYPGTTFTNQNLTDTGDHTTFIIPTGAAARRVWDDTASFVFQTGPDGSTWTNTPAAVIDYAIGRVTFASAVTGGTPSARVSSGTYLPYAALGTATGWSPDVSRELSENTVMTVNTTPTIWKKYQPGLLSGIFKLDGFLSDPTYLAYLTQTTPLIIQLVFDVTTGARMSCKALMTKDSFKAMINDLETETLDFQINGPVYLQLS